MRFLIRFSLITVILTAALTGANALATDHHGGRNFPAGSGGINAPYQLNKPYVIMISIDGFRWDYMDIHRAPSISRLAKEGVQAEHLIPVFPTLTFPNHYSIATGLYPAHHGLMANTFPLENEGDWYRIGLREAVENGSYYRGEPIWITAETQGMVAASFFWVGTEADIQGMHPTHWRRYNKSIKGAERVDQVLEWLAKPEASRPHLYTLYFEDVDDYGHWNGPESSETAEAVARVDRYIDRLLQGIKTLPHGDQVNIILVSDHGQAAFLDEQPLIIEQLTWLDGVTSVDGGCYVFMHLDEPDPKRAIEIRDAINNNWQHGRAHLKEDAPADWHVTADARFPDVIVVAEPGYGVLSTQQIRFKATHR